MEDEAGGLEAGVRGSPGDQVSQAALLPKEEAVRVGQAPSDGLVEEGIGEIDALGKAPVDNGFAPMPANGYRRPSF